MQNMSEPIISLRNVNKVFRIPHEKVYSFKETFLNLVKGRLRNESIHALKNINLEIKKGEFLGVIGKNGSGKSTLLKVIAGVYVPTSGNVHIGGEISPFLELGLGFNPDLSAKENVYLYCAILGMNKQQIEKKYPSIVKFAGLEKFMDSPLKTFSSGMQVRLAFSTAIQADAPILLVDEVLAVGDAGFQKKCLGVFEYFRQKGKTIIFVSHDMETVKNFCDRVILLENGEVMKVGGKSETIDYYIRSWLKNKK